MTPPFAGSDGRPAQNGAVGYRTPEGVVTEAGRLSPVAYRSNVVVKITDSGSTMRKVCGVPSGYAPTARR